MYSYLFIIYIYLFIYLYMHLAIYLANTKYVARFPHKAATQGCCAALHQSKHPQPRQNRKVAACSIDVQLAI